MQHLTTETLARLVDDLPTPDEERHLNLCEICNSELDLLREQTVALAALPDAEPPATLWLRIEERLVNERLAEPRVRHGSERGAWLRAASYVGLFLLGTGTGLAIGRGSVAPAAGSDTDGVEAAGITATAPEAAEQRLREAEAEYSEALATFSELVVRVDEVDPVTRLTALEGIVLTTGAALEAAPADPLINGYYLSAVGQRDAVLRQIVQTSQHDWF